MKLALILFILILPGFWASSLSLPLSPSDSMGTGFCAMWTMFARGTYKNLSSTIPLNLWPWLIVTCEQHCGKHVVQVLHSPASCLCSASTEGRGGGKEERELFNPPQRNSPLNPYRKLTGKSRCWKAHHTHTAVFLISSAERNLYSALESDWAAERSELYSTLECKQVSHQL